MSNSSRTTFPIALNRPDLPPLEELVPLLQDIWDRGQLSNCGRYHSLFEKSLQHHLRVPRVCLLANATLGLMAACRALDLSGEVVTSPFTFVATLNALCWAGLKPVFADIDEHTLALDPAAALSAVGPQTSALLPVHGCGHPCDVAAFGALAAHRGLRLLYDAAPALGVRVGGRSVLAHGDAAVVSFHATKVLNTFEGGAVVCADARVHERLCRMRNHGLDTDGLVQEAGLNAKMSEFNAALGLLQLPRLAQAVARRRAVDETYRAALAAVPGIECLPPPPADVQSNHAYFPVFVTPAYPLTRDALYQRLQAQGIDARRYYSPLVCDLPAFRHLAPRDPDALAVARRCAAQVLCLPIHPCLTAQQQQRIVELIAQPLHGARLSA